jgi:hypothetical protein
MLVKTEMLLIVLDLYELRAYKSNKSILSLVATFDVIQNNDVTDALRTEMTYTKVVLLNLYII